MAKQSGLHQLRGKVGEHSYYKQTGVASGLVRSINQGMSARVKTSEEYANVRLNNAEFGQAGRIAKVLGQLISPKYRPMLLPFSQSKLCKAILDAIRKDTKNPWGQRNIDSSNSSINVVVKALNSICKNDPESYGLSVATVEDQLEVRSNHSITEAKLAAIGADGFDLRVVAAAPWIGTYFSDGYAESFARANFYDEVDFVPGSTFDCDYIFRPVPPQAWPAFRLTFGIVIILPYRKINAKKYTLQESCTYFAFDTPDGD